MKKFRKNINSGTKMIPLTPTTSEEWSASTSVRVSDAQLLLSLSHVPNHKYNGKKQLQNEQTEDQNRKTLDENKKQQTASKKRISELKITKIIDEDLGEYQKKPFDLENMLPVSEPVYQTESGIVGTAENLPKETKMYAKDIEESQSDEMFQVTKDEYEILKIIKAKSLTRSQLSRLPSQEQEIPDSDNDVNNNLNQQSNLEDVALGDLSFDDTGEIENKVMSFNSTNKLILLKAIERFERRKNEQIAFNQAMLLKRISVTNILKEVLSSIGEKHHHFFAKRFDKTTQTERIDMQDIGCSTVDESDKKDKNTSVTLVQQMQPVQGHPASTVQTRVPPNNTYNYPNTLMMSALQIIEPHRQYCNLNNNWNMPFGAKSVGPTVDQQQYYLPTLAAATSTRNATYPPQQTGSGLNIPTMASPVNQIYPGKCWFSMQIQNQNQENAQLKNRRLKNTPLRNAVYNEAGQRYLPSVQGKYQYMIEQQRLQAMAAQQRAWELRMQNNFNPTGNRSCNPN